MAKKNPGRMDESEVMNINDDILTPETAAEILNVTKWAMYKRAKNGTVPGHYMGRRLYFLKSELVECVRKK